MDSIVFNVKDKSANAFFMQHAIDMDYIDKPHMRTGPDTSPYHLMKDDIYLKKSSGITEGQQVIFELEDISMGSRTKLINIYTYQSYKYDDVSVKLELMNFDVKHIKV